LVLTSRSPESGEATVNFACKYEGADVEIGFTRSSWTEALRVVDSDEISLELTARIGRVAQGRTEFSVCDYAGQFAVSVAADQIVSVPLAYWLCRRHALRGAIAWRYEKP